MTKKPLSIKFNQMIEINTIVMNLFQDSQKLEIAFRNLCSKNEWPF